MRQKKIYKRAAVLAFALAALSLCLTAAGCSLSELFAPKKTPPIMPHLISESQAESRPVRPVDGREQSPVTGESYKARQDSLYAVVTGGKKPTFGPDAADVKAIYDAAIAVLDRYILNDFTVYQRVHAIHDYLCYYVEYDIALYERYLAGEGGITQDDDSFNLSGVFIGKSAVCDGISKAMSFLCSIEGIENSRIIGEYKTEDGADAHAWNKVKVDGNWYNADATLDRAQIAVDGEILPLIHHGYFLVSDRAVRDVTFGRHTPDFNIAVNPVNEATPENSYPVYEDLTLTIDGKSYSSLITTQEQLNQLITAVRKAKREVGKLDIRIKLDGVNANRVGALDFYLQKAMENLKDSDFAYHPNIGTRPYFQYPDGVLLLLIYR